MKSKLVSKVLFLLISMFILPFMFNINLNAKEEVDLSCIEKVKINENEIHLLINEIYGTISIENDCFSIETSFTLYSIDGSALAYNTVILDCRDNMIIYAGLNFNTNTLNYIVLKQNKYYFSSVEFVKINAIVDLFSETIKEELLNINKMSYSIDENKYLDLEETARSAFVCFNVNHNNIPNANSRVVQPGYYLTGENQSVVNEVTGFINSGMLNPDEFVDEGVHNGLIRDNDGKVAYIYAIDTDVELPWNVYAAGIKMWKITYNYFSQGSYTLIKVDIEPFRDIYIVGNEISGQVQYPYNDDNSYFPILNIKFSLTTTGISYIDEYHIDCEYMGNPDTPSALGIIDNLLVKFCPKYRAISEIINLLDDASSYVAQIGFNNQISGFEINNGDQTARSIGFDLSHNDVNTSSLNVKWLNKYSFYQTMSITDVPNYDITNFVRIQMVPTYHDNVTITFEWDSVFENGCQHSQLSYSNLDNNVHYVHCNQCNKSFKEVHSKYTSGSYIYCEKCNYLETHTHNYTHSYTQSGALNHIAYCSCGASKTEAHTFQAFKNGNRCKYCLYFTTGPISGGQIFGINRSIIYIEDKEEDYI